MKTAEQFWDQVDKTGGSGACWPWLAGKTKAGYGSVRWNGVITPAHRIAFVLAKGPIEDGMFICHHCDNRPCCNPEHLFQGDAWDNARDMSSKGRSAATVHVEQFSAMTRGSNNISVRYPESVPKGSDRASSVLTDEQVMEIRKKYIPYEYGCRKIAAEFGVSEMTISRIVRRQLWKHLP